MKAFIIFRDRVGYGRLCLNAMLTADLDVIIVDHGSTFPAAVDWLKACERVKIPVWYHGGGSPRELWGKPDFIAACGDERFVVTDPDTVPDENCPADWPEHLSELLDSYPVPKIGMGLRIDDIPAHYPRRQQVLDWESQYWRTEISPGLYGSAVDTTLAMCRNAKTGFGIDGARTGAPYLARHLAWYEDPAALTDDITYYYANLESGISFWTIGVRSEWGN